MAQSNIGGKIVIIGAGISGIAAAQSLHKAGATDVVILEAKDRVGGRIFTQKLDGKALDLGAEFVHGAQGNPVHELAVAHHLLPPGEEDGEDSDDDPETNYHYTPKGHVVPPEIVGEVMYVLDEIFEDLNKYSRNDVPIGDDDETIGTFVYRKFYEYLQGRNDSEEVIRYKESLFNWRLLAENSDNACKSLYELSVYAWGEYLECHGNPEQRFSTKYGFQGILDLLLAEVPPSWFRLQCPVKVVYWDPSICVPFVKGLRTNEMAATSPDHHAALPRTQHPIQIHTATGDIIPADHVIVTSSLGFLKRHAHTMFRPLLPTDKMAVIQHMGFGTVNKIFLQFETRFWDKDCEEINLVWTNDEPFVLRCVDNKQTEEYLHNDWFRAIHSFEVVPGHTALLEGWIAGEEAEIMETVPDQVVMEICLEILQRFTGNPNIPRPVKIIRSSWHKDNQILGSYSYIKAGHTGAACDVLARPLDKEGAPRLMFAGEATHRQYYSTTHGALLSGRREAERIVKFYTDSKKPAAN